MADLCNRTSYQSLSTNAGWHPLGFLQGPLAASDLIIYLANTAE